jgi:hypothetical protein
MQMAHAALSAWWQASGKLPLAANPGNEAISAIEQRYEIKLPEDFRTYLLLCAPKEFFCDAGNTDWWSPERLKNIPDEYAHPITNSKIAANARSYIFFADYLIWSHAWAICCDDGEDRGRVALIGGLPDHFVANSFTEFVGAYTTNPSSVM